jgi:hypothetical protein
MGINLVSTYYMRPFTSDDVFWQVILRTWHPFNGSTVTLGNSSIYIDKIPLFDFFIHFFKPSRRVLFDESAIGLGLGFTSYYAAAIYFLKKSGAKLSYITLAPFVWLSSFGYEFILLYLNPNWRGFQIGISFGVFALAASMIFGDLKIKSVLAKILLVLGAAFAGLQTYSDPYFLYFTIAPIILLLIILAFAKKIPRARFKPVIISILLALIFAKLIGAVSTAAGVRTALDYPAQFVSFDSLPGNFTGAINSILVIFGADFFGQKVSRPHTILALLNFLLLVFASYIACSLLLKARHVKLRSLPFDKLWQTFFAFVGLMVFVTYIISTLTEGTATYRYFLMLVLLFVMILAIELSLLTKPIHQYIFVAILLIASFMNLAYTQYSYHYNVPEAALVNKANYQNYLFIQAVSGKGYTKGYANYWQGNINSYLSGGNVSFLPSICYGGTETKKFHWLINDAAFYKPASKSFYLEDPDIAAPSTCDVKYLLKQFGTPISTQQIGDKTILYYNYDITSKIPDFSFQ